MFKRRTGKLKYLPEVTAFSSVMLILLAIYILVILPRSVPSAHSVDLPRVQHPTSLSNANKYDAIRISVDRDGSIYFGQERIRDLSSIPTRIREAVRAGAERKVYIMAANRKKVGNVNEIVDVIRRAGIEDIAFLAEDRDPIPPATTVKN